ncbi:MAG TPA: diacylglycerol kinase family protein [Anaerolineae bacterium]|nr:diacylglycerol kinase family protein [Anaerolineae bacterium]
MRAIVTMRTLVIYNPAAGRPRLQRQVPDAIAELHAAGWTVDLAETTGPDSALHLARAAAARGYHAVVVAGGDGTVNQAANGLLQARSAGQALPALGILPAGTANVLARDLGLPVPVSGLEATLPAAARLLARSRIVSIDVGVARIAAEERYFLCWAGVGLDAAVTADVMANPKAKRRLGVLYFAGNLLARLPGIKNAPRYMLAVDGQIWQGQGILAVVSNIQHYAVVLDMAPSALLTDGLLDVAFFHGITLWNAGGTLARLLTSQHPSDPNVRYAQARQISIETARPQAVHVDAEPFGVTPVEITVLPRALPFLAPPTVEAKRLAPPASA